MIVVGASRLFLSRLAAEQGVSSYLRQLPVRTTHATREVGQGRTVTNNVSGQTRIRKVPADLRLLLFGPYAPVGFLAGLLLVQSMTGSWPVAALVSGTVVIGSVAITAWAIILRRPQSGRPERVTARMPNTEFRAKWLPRVGAEAVAFDVQARRCSVICQSLFPVVALLGIVTRDVRVFLPAVAVGFAVGLVGAAAIDQRNRVLGKRFGVPIGKRDLRRCLNDRDWESWASRTGRNPATRERT